jgi:hypothetical protein
LIVDWTDGLPSEWRPDNVTDPRSGEPFTAFGAWEYIAELLESGHPFREVELKVPPGAHGYVLEVDVGVHHRPLYIKLQLLRDQVAGRSFHYTIYERKR